MLYRQKTEPVSTHSRLKAAGGGGGGGGGQDSVSTHSRLKAAGKCTAPKLAGEKFQHTAA